MDRYKVLPPTVAVTLFLIVAIIFRTGIRTLTLAMWIAYGAVLAAAVAAACSHWRTAPNLRIVWRAALAGHVVAVAAFFVSELLRPDGITRVSNSFRALGAEFILVSLSYPLRFGGLVVGLGTALILVLVARVGKLRSPPLSDQS